MYDVLNWPNLVKLFSNVLDYALAFSSSVINFVSMDLNDALNSSIDLPLFNTPLYVVLVGGAITNYLVFFLGKSLLKMFL